MAVRVRGVAAAAAALLAVLCMVMMAAPVAADVKTLTAQSFDKELESIDLAFVKFYAPWCGHCKALAPIFVEAEKALKDEAVLAEVNCDDEKGVARRFSVKGYPTLIIFRKGKEVGRYDGARDLDSIVRYVRSFIGDVMRHVKTTDELQALQKKQTSTPLCIIKTASSNSTLMQQLTPLAETLRTSFAFALVTDAAVLPEVAMETVTVMRDGDEVEMYTGDTSDEAALTTFMKTASTPFLGEINGHTFRLYANAARPMGWLFLSNNSASKELRPLLLPTVRKHRDSLITCWLNADLYGPVGKQLGLPENVSYPMFVIEKDKKHYVHPLNTTVDETSIAEFIEGFVNGTVKPTLMSEPVPEQPTVNGLTTLVGSTLPQYTESGKDVFIFFYAPWCQHCKQFHPVYDKIAKHFDGSEGLIIGKFDITANHYDSDKFTVDGIPTLYFVPANGKPELYSGDRSEAAVIDYIRSHASMPTKLVHNEDKDANNSADEAADSEATTDSAEGDSAGEDDDAKEDL